MKMVVGALLGLFVMMGSARAERLPIQTAGEDPFPLMCADFSGSWKSDSGDRYTITQSRCAYLKVQIIFGSENEVMNIVPDNKTRYDRGTSVRHRWNSPDNATVLESHRIFMDTPNIRETVVTMFERANDDLLLQTTYRTVEYLDGSCAPQHFYNQAVFRRQDSGGKGLDQPVPGHGDHKKGRHYRD